MLICASAAQHHRHSPHTGVPVVRKTPRETGLKIPKVNERKYVEVGASCQLEGLLCKRRGALKAEQELEGHVRSPDRMVRSQFQERSSVGCLQGVTGDEFGELQNTVPRDMKQGAVSRSTSQWYRGGVAPRGSLGSKQSCSQSQD